MEEKEIGLYVHIPFCKSKCLYCDFVSFANKNDMVERYIECVKKEIIQNVSKVYILLQSNKINKMLSNKISNVTDIHGIITSNDMNKVIEKSLKYLKINLIYSH